MRANRQSGLLWQDRRIKRFIDVFRAMFPIVAFELCFGLFFVSLAAAYGDWRASALPLSILVLVAIVTNCCYLIFNWDNPMI